MSFITYHFTILRWGSPENLMKSAYLVSQGYANLCKHSVRELNPGTRLFKFNYYYDPSNCHPYQFLEICIPLYNGPIGLIQKGHIKDILAMGEAENSKNKQLWEIFFKDFVNAPYIKNLCDEWPIDAKSAVTFEKCI